MYIRISHFYRSTDEIAERLLEKTRQHWICNLTSYCDYFFIFLLKNNQINAIQQKKYTPRKEKQKAF